MAIFEFSDGFDAQGWYTEQMLKGHFKEEFEVFVDHEAGFDDCDPGMLAWSEAQLAYWD